IVSPVSSATSRCKASRTDSPNSTAPPGSPQRPLSVRCCRRIRPSPSTITAETPGRICRVADTALGRSVRDDAGGALAHLGVDGAGEVEEGAALRVCRIGDHDRRSGVAGRADRAHQRDLAEEGYAELPRHPLAAAVSEHLDALAAVPADVEAHVL